jgi:large subunit ribosomal protein L6
LTYHIPPFVQIEHDEVSRKAIVNVEDREIRKQREMWGMFGFLINCVQDCSLTGP